MRRKADWKPKGQRRAASGLKVEPYKPGRCVHHPDRPSVVFEAGGAGLLCGSCAGFDLDVPQRTRETEEETI